MNFSKITGWVLLIAGVILIGWVLFSSYNIFTARAELPEFFVESYGGPAEASGEGGEIPSQIQQMISEQLKGIIPADSIIKLLNLVVWSMLAFILIFGGSQIAGLGIKLIKK
jgi:hypothetical protein